MTTLVTGATGFLGSAVVRALLARGDDVAVLARPHSDRRNLDGLSVTVREGDLTDQGSLERACHGCEALYHVAADYRLWTRNPQELYDSNVAGTRNLMLAALECNMNRIVYTSSVATLGLHQNGEPANEETPVTIDDMVGHYKRSKLLAEREVDKLVEEHSLPAIIVNPSTPIGPRDIKPTPTGDIILRFLRGQMPAYLNTGLNLIDVRDVADGHLLAYEQGETGERYILGHQNMTLKEILEELASITGLAAPKYTVPFWLPLGVAWIEEYLLAPLGKSPSVPVDGVKMSRQNMFMKHFVSLNVIKITCGKTSLVLRIFMHAHCQSYIYLIF